MDQSIDPDEWFDVVDSRDRVIGRATRADVHGQNLLHRAAHVLVFNRAGNLFLQKRALTKDDSPGRWDSSAAGHLAAGENYQEAAVRELEEELGLVVEGPLRRLFQIAGSPETEYEFAWVFRCSSEGPFQLDPVEIDTGKWATPEAVSDWIARNPEDFSPTFRVIWAHLTSQARH